MLSSGASRSASIALLVGLVLFTAVALSQGLEPIGQTFRQAGGRILVLAPLFFVPLVVSSLGWGALFDARFRPPLRTLLYARWVGFAANQLLPVARIGGEVIRARIALLDASGANARTPKDGGGLKTAAVAASLIADKTAQVAAVVVFGSLGLFLFAHRRFDVGLVRPGIAGAIVLAALTLAFYAAQRRGLIRFGGGLVARALPRGQRTAFQASTEATHTALFELYRTGRPLVAVLAHVAFRVGLALELWLLSSWFGHPIDFGAALMFEGMNQILRAATFMIPGSLGTQETGFIVLGEALGVPAPLALSLSLGKRVRELLVGLPALAIWQIHEGRALRRAAQGAK